MRTASGAVALNQRSRKTLVRMCSGAFAAACLLLLSGCGITDVICTDEAVPALAVAVVDSVSGETVVDPLVWVRDGSSQDTLTVFDGIASGLHERAGTYEVHAEHEGYAPWVRTGVTVTEGQCHVITRELTARLQAP